MLTQQEIAQIKDAAEKARRAGRARISCPRYPDTAAGRARREAWEGAFDAEDKRIKSLATAEAASA